MVTSGIERFGITTPSATKNDPGFSDHCRTTIFAKETDLSELHDPKATLDGYPV